MLPSRAMAGLPAGNGLFLNDRLIYLTGAMPPVHMANSDIVILGAARTPIGKYGGSFKDVVAPELGAVAARAALARAGVPASEIEEVLMGHGRPGGGGPNAA